MRVGSKTPLTTSAASISSILPRSREPHHSIVWMLASPFLAEICDRSMADPEYYSLRNPTLNRLDRRCARNNE